MTTPTNVENTRSIYDAFARGDVGGVIAHFDPAIEWNEAEHFPYADRNPYLGADAIVQGVFARLASEWEGFGVVTEKFIDGGDQVVTCGRYRGKQKAAGFDVNAQFAHVWTWQDGRVVRFQQYTDTLQFAGERR